MAELFYPNYYTVGALITTLFSGFIVYFLFRIPNRGRATTHVWLTIMSMTIFNMAYVLNNGFYGSPSFIWRWVAVTTALFGAIHITVYTWFFYRQLSDRYIRYYWIASYTILAGLCGFLLFRFFQEPLYYSFSAHNWEAAAPDLFRLAGLIIFVFFLISIIIPTVRALRSTGTERAALGSLALANVVVMLIPGILNVLSRGGSVSRDAYQTATVLMNLAGFFILMFSFINYTRDRTPFLAKVVMISLVTLLFIMQINSYFWFKAMDEAYDREHKEISEKLEFNPNNPKLRPPDYRYRITRNLETNELNGNGRWPKKQRTTLIGPAMENTYLWYRMSSERGDPRHIAADASPTFAGYRFTIRDLRTSGWSSEEILEKISDLAGRIGFARSSVSALPTDEKLRPGLEKVADRLEGPLPGFAEALNNLLKKTELGNVKLKNKALGLFAPMQAPGTRQYRGKEYIGRTEEVPEHYVSYILITENTVNEIGYDYRAYRQAIAQTGWIQFGLIVGVFIFILIAFRIFFSRTMAQPLNAVITGIKDVESGNLDRRVPVVMEDEIGFLTGAFNRMVASIQDARRKLEEYADSLEDKVKERTRELKESLDEIQLLKNQQDGDYFLTTLLLKPLGVNQALSNHHRIEFLIRQKKRFDFRHWSRDIGGDINISHSIRLRNQRYIVFMNADAMGKSIQGAGGALVLGSVLLSIIERTATLDSVSNLHPERWLKNAFIELHKVFESFDGSMLVSTFFGLVDDRSGLIYYINAEHPLPVLWRDGTASFIGGDEMLRKLGTAGSIDKICIATFQLEEGDCLISGSDGKDDILLGTDEAGGRIINENEEKFLEFVTETEGDLRAIEKKLRKFGELIDDLSLLKIQRTTQRPVTRIKKANKNRFDQLQNKYRHSLEAKDYQQAAQQLDEALQIAPDNPALLKALAKAHYRTSNFAAARRAAAKYTDLRPDDAEFFLFAAWCLRKNNEWGKAIDMAERLRLRQPEHIGALEFLIEASLKLKQGGRAYTLNQALLRADSNNAKAQRWNKEIPEPPKEESDTRPKRKSSLW